MADANLENVAARIRARRYGSSADRLAADVAQGLASQTKLASYRRGLAGGVVAGQDGGTTLGVGDNFAAFTSASLQPPQRGLPAPNGALGVRMQGRVEMERRTLPGIVVASNAGEDALELTVVVPYAQTPRLGVDETTGQNTAATEAFDGLLTLSAQAAAGTLDDSEAITVSVPFPAEGESPYENGQIIDVTTIRQWDVRTIWSNRENRRIPVVVRSLASTSHSTPSTAAVPDDVVEPPITCSRLGINAELGTSGLANSNGIHSITWRYTPS
jgi:hypothetical protein